ncbi:MAG: PEP-CTERM sorting domain-containing protein [Syntrophobacterales bacterium]|jgi:hypothetical protein|nr:PEP-CTERM sorting domain-containing protein [Syntrophobacterales bacterium]
MKRGLVLGFLLAILVGISAMAMADTFTPTSSTGVYYAINDSGFYTNSTGYSGGNVQSYNTGSVFNLTGVSSGDAGIVLYFNGSLKLGNLLSVSTISAGGPLAVNLWLDTGGDGHFWSYDSSGMLTGLAGDSYGGYVGSSINDSTVFYGLGGISIEGKSLAQLKNGDVSGIGAETPVALWIGLNTPGQADISSVTVQATPLPGTLLLLGSGLTGLVLWRRRKAAVS